MMMAPFSAATTSLRNSAERTASSRGRNRVSAKGEGTEPDAIPVGGMARDVGAHAGDHFAIRRDDPDALALERFLTGDRTPKHRGRVVSIAAGVIVVEMRRHKADGDFSDDSFIVQSA